MTTPPTRPTRPAVETRGLTKSYGRTVALASLDLRVEPGEVFGLLGPNGAGKTTLVKLLLGLARATGGEGAVLGRPLGDLAARRRIGYLPELFRYQPWLSAREVLGLHARLGGIQAPGIDAALERVGLERRGDDRVGTFSKGMQQRLGLAVALLGRPELVLLDEPTSALDPVGRDDVRTIVRDARAAGITVVVNSHLLGEVERVCDRVAIVDRGRVVAAGRLDDLLGEPTLRLRAEPVAAALDVLGRFGTVHDEGDGWLVVDALVPDRVAGVVAALVAAGVAVHAAVPARRTLEDVFLALVRTEAAARGEPPS